MAEPHDTNQLLSEIADSAHIIRERTRRMYRDMEITRRLTAQHLDLVSRLIRHVQEGDTDA